MADTTQNEQETVQTTHETTATQTEKTFTQAELDTIVSKRLAKVQRSIPSEEELAAFRAWKNSQQTEQQKWDAMKAERDAAKTELTAAQSKIEQYEREKILLGKGVSLEDVDYYAFKIGKLVTDNKNFEQAATEYFSGNKPRGAVIVDLGGSLTGGLTKNTPNEAMNALIRGARK